MSLIELNNVSVGFGASSTRTEVLRDINLTINEGELVAIVGYSGSGKSTLVNLIAGLVKPDQGAALFDGKPITGPGPERGLVFQTYALLPWLSVRGNVALAVNQVCQDESLTERNTRIADAVDQVKLTPALSKLPSELSGGMRQRVSVARALSFAPRVLLLDEPLSALDALTRSELQDQIIDLKQRSGQTILLITNDVDEALYMADRVIPLTMGPAATFGPVEEVRLRRPRDRATLLAEPEVLAARTRLLDFLIAQRADNAENLSIRELPGADPVDVRAFQPNFAFRWVRDREEAQTGVPAVPKHKESHKPAEGFVTISQLGKTYPTPRGEAVIVRDFDLHIKRGDLVSIIGHSGCGKMSRPACASCFITSTRRSSSTSPVTTSKPSALAAASTKSPAPCPKACASASVWPAPSPCSRKCCCSTSPSACSTNSPSWSFKMCCSICVNAPAPRPSWSRTMSMRPSTSPIRSS